jgi:hypothetical protein
MFRQRISPLETKVAARLSSLARRGYYLARPLLPRSIQIKARRSFSRVPIKGSLSALARRDRPP